MVYLTLGAHPSSDEPHSVCLVDGAGLESLTPSAHLGAGHQEFGMKDAELHLCLTQCAEGCICTHSEV